MQSLCIRGLLPPAKQETHTQSEHHNTIRFSGCDADQRECCTAATGARSSPEGIILWSRFLSTLRIPPRPAPRPLVAPPFHIAHRPLPVQKIQDRLIQINFEPTYVGQGCICNAYIRTCACTYVRGGERASIGSNDLPRSKCNDTFPPEPLAGPVLPLHRDLLRIGRIMNACNVCTVTYGVHLPTLRRLLSREMSRESLGQAIGKWAR